MISIKWKKVKKRNVITNSYNLSILLFANSFKLRIILRIETDFLFFEIVNSEAI